MIEVQNINEEPLPTTSDDLFKVLKSLDIHYKLYEHEPVFTVAESEALDRDIEGTPCRNLFVRDKKKRSFLIVVANETAVDLKKTQDLLECGRLSFGSAERLWEMLGIRSGSVNPFTVLNDAEHKVQVVLDGVIMRSSLMNVHPMDNAMTISLAPEDLMRFLEHSGHEPIVLDF